MTEPQYDIGKLRAAVDAATPGTWIAAPRSSVVGQPIVAVPEGRSIANVTGHDNGPANATRNGLLEDAALGRMVRAAAETGRDALLAAFVTSESGPNGYKVVLKVRDLETLFSLHDAILKARKLCAGR